MTRISRLADSLDDTYLVAPTKVAAVPGGAEERLRRFGGIAGAVGGAGLGSLLPVALGVHTGGRIGRYVHNIAEVASDVFGGDPGMQSFTHAVTDPVTRGAGMVAGGALGIPVMPLGAGLGGMLGYETGRSLGGTTGSAIDAMRSVKSKALAESRSLPLSHAYSYLQTARQLGTVSPDVLSALEQDYQVRRETAISTGQSKVAFDMARSAIAPAGVPGLEREGRRIGRGLGALAGAGVAFGMPFLMAPLGGAGGQVFHGLGQSWDWDLPEGLGKAVGGAVGAGVGGILGLRMLPERTILPMIKGSLTGRVLGDMGGLVEKLAPEHRRLVSEIQKLPPDEAYAVIKSVERAGNVAPETLQNIRASYEARRLGLASGIDKTSAFDPLDHPATSPAPRRRLSRAGILLGGLAGAGSGYLLGEYLFPSEVSEKAMETVSSAEYLPKNMASAVGKFVDAADTGRMYAQGVGAFAGGLAGSIAGYGIGKGLEQIPFSRRERGINRIRGIKSPELEAAAIGEALANGTHPAIVGGMEEARKARELSRADLALARGYP